MARNSHLSVQLEISSANTWIGIVVGNKVSGRMREVCVRSGRIAKTMKGPGGRRPVYLLTNVHTPSLLPQKYAGLHTSSSTHFLYQSESPLCPPMRQLIHTGKPAVRANNNSNPTVLFRAQTRGLQK